MKYRPPVSPSGLFVYGNGALLVAWAVLAVCVFCPVRTAQAQGTGSIGLTVVNGTTGQPMAGHEVLLLNHSAQEGPDQTLARVVTDGDGRYEFTGLRADGSHYVIATRYLEIPYLTGHIPLEPGTGRVDTLLQVFDITTDESALVHSAVHLVIDAGPEILNVTEIIVVENRGIFTFAPPPGVGLGLVYNLPAAAFGLQPMMEGLQHTERGLLFSAPVPPGVSRVVYAYNVDRASIDHRFNRQMDYDIERVQVLVSPSTQTVTATNLTNHGVQQIAADEYLVLSNRVGVGRGMSVEVAFPSVLAWQGRHEVGDARIRVAHRGRRAGGGHPRQARTAGRTARPQRSYAGGRTQIRCDRPGPGRPGRPVRGRRTGPGRLQDPPRPPQGPGAPVAPTRERRWVIDPHPASLAPPVSPALLARPASQGPLALRAPLESASDS